MSPSFIKVLLRNFKCNGWASVCLKMWQETFVKGRLSDNWHEKTSFADIKIV